VGHHFGVPQQNVAADQGLGFRLVVAIAVMWFTAMALISGSKTCTSTIHQRLTTMVCISNLKLVKVKFYARMLEGVTVADCECKPDDPHLFLTRLHWLPRV
jgi:hypothetical protein